MSAQNLKYTKIITSLGATGIEREHQSIEFTKDDGIFSDRFECKDHSSQKCLDTKDIGPPLSGTYDMKKVEKYGGSWWLDEAVINRRLEIEESFIYMRKVSHMGVLQ